ncbi:MAG: M23 family metallopeptidase [Deltaproteobacteria bacterium]|nr:M23 family metallopeptidase [Deltaproteobacteria bacterium]
MTSSLRMDKTKQKKPLIVFLIPLILLAGLGIALFLLLEWEKPRIEVAGKLDLIGTQRQIDFVVSDGKSGIRHVAVVVRQGGEEKKLHEQTFERQGYFRGAGQHRIEGHVSIDANSLGIKEGAAELVFTAWDFSYWNLLRGNVVELVFPVTLDTQPPKLTSMDSSLYISSGGAGLVTYKISETAVKHGAITNGFFHPGFLIPGNKDLYGAMVAFPYDAQEIKEAYVIAEDAAGNVGKTPFTMIFKKVNFKQDKITIPETFLDVKIPEFSQYYPEMSGSQLDKYLYVNSKVRNENNQKIMEICSSSTPEQLWRGRFGRMPGSPRAGYADHRTYFYNEQEVDKQVHLGIDIASTERDKVGAANRGKVVFADYLGIYGNMVILDHGLGLFSLYSHLSAIEAAKGDLLEKGAVLGITGTTGMAGGDHLHFSMLVNGILVNPIEWWDDSWVELHILNFLKPAKDQTPVDSVNVKN